MPIDLEVDRLRAKFEQQLQASADPDWREYVELVQPSLQPELVRQLVLTQLDHLAASGRSISTKTVIDRLPDHEATIRSAAVQWENGRLERSAPSGTERNPAACDETTLAYRDTDADRLNESAEDGYPTPGRLGDYRILAKIGRGAFGDVFRVRDKDGHIAAMKVLRPEQMQAAERKHLFQAEAETLRRLRHPGIVEFRDYLELPDGTRCLVTEYLAGGSLADRLRDVGDFSPRRLARWVAVLAEALHCMHLAGYAHRDVKPANILLDDAGNPRLADVGLALNDRDYGAGNPHVAGSLAYLSPEQARGDSHLVDGRSDIYSLGVVLYELLAGRRPMRADQPSEMLRRICQIEAKPLRQIKADIPASLEAICMKALAKQPAERYATASDFAQALRQFASPIPRSWRGGAAVAALLLIGAVALPFLPPSGGRVDSVNGVNEASSVSDANNVNDADNFKGNAAAEGQPADSPMSAFDANLRIEVSPDGGAFFPVDDFRALRRGDVIRFSARFSEPVYVALYWLDAAGEISELYPHDPEEGFRGGQPITELDSPIQLDRGWPIQPAGPSEVALLIASDKPIGGGLIGNVDWSAEDFPDIQAVHSYAANSEFIVFGTAGSMTRSLGSSSEQINDPIRRLLERLRKQENIVHLQAVHVPTQR